MSAALPPQQATVRTVPFLDLDPSNGPLRDAVLAELADVIDANAFVNGPQVAAFEEAFAAYCGADDCVGVASGLDALRLALAAAGLEPGERGRGAGGDVRRDVRGGDAGGRRAGARRRSRRRLADSTPAPIPDDVRFVMPVHLYGRVADARACRRSHGGRRRLPGARRPRRRCCGRACGGASASIPARTSARSATRAPLVTDDAALAAHVRALREHGQTAKYEHELEG